MTDIATTIAGFHELDPRRFAILDRFALTQAVASPPAGALSLALDLRSEQDGLGVLHLAFEGIRELKIDWPSWSLIKTDVIEISDVSDRGMEDLRFRVHEGAGMFAFYCRGFSVTID